jgi:sulfonate transport system permease protein
MSNRPMAEALDTARAPWPRPWSGLRPGLRRVALPLLLLGLFELGARRAVALGSEVLAPPSAALQALLGAAFDGSLWAATAFTLGSVALGLSIGTGLGTLAGVALGLRPRAARASFLGVEMFRSLPAVALLPLFMLAFGFGLPLQVCLVAIGTFWPQVLLTQAAVRQVDPQLLALARLLGLGPLASLFKIVLPAAFTRLFTALRLCLAFALQIAVTVEIAGNPHGMGYSMLLAQQSLTPALMIAWLGWIGLIGVLLNAALLRLQAALDRRMGGLA